MLHTDVLNTLWALSLNEKPLITPAPDKDNSDKGAFELGQKVQGAIQAEVSPGLFKVRVLEQMLHMHLPESLKCGDVVELQVMSLQPRLTFSLSASGNPLSTPEQLSNTSRLLSFLAQQPLEKAHVRTARSDPLLATAEAVSDTGKLAGKLHESLSQSGLFYEAHQAQWMAGARSTAQLLQEPQNLLAASTKTPSGDTAAVTVNTSNAPNITAQLLQEPQNLLTASPKISSGDTAAASTNIPAQLQPLVQQQLNALETRQVLWQGQVWPNQKMDWEIHEETPRRSAAEYDSAGAQWATQIRLDLPNLGEVAALLRFNQHGLSITLDAADADTRALFGSASSQLSATLAERGINVFSTLLASHDKP